MKNDKIDFSSADGSLSCCWVCDDDNLMWWCKLFSCCLFFLVHTVSPKCVTSEAAQVPLAIGETQWLTCSILAWPSDLNFYWTLNRSDSGGNGKIRRGESNIGSSFRNITEYYHRLPISNVEREVVAPGVNNNVTSSSISKSNLQKELEEGSERGGDLVNAVKEKTEQKDSSDQTGYPQLSSGSSSESLDYPEDQHMPQHHPDVSSKNAMTTDNMEGTRSGSVLLTASGKEEKRSSQKDILFEKSYSTEGKAISAKENRKSSMDHSVPFTPSDVVLSTSTRDTYSANKFNISFNKLSFPVNTAAKLTSVEYVASKVGVRSENEKKTKRHVVYPSSTSSSYFSSSNVDGKSRTGDHGSGHGFQDKIRHKSLISYQVKSDEDYGTVACWATNSFGSQVFPCLFHIIKSKSYK